MLGIVTLQEVKHIAKEDWGKNLVSDIMVPAEEVQSVKPNDSLALVMQKMLRANVNQLAVREGDKFLGVVSRDGVLEFLGLLMELKK
jgi:CBS domain-containing protein